VVWGGVGPCRSAGGSIHQSDSGFLHCQGKVPACRKSSKRYFAPTSSSSWTHYLAVSRHSLGDVLGFSAGRPQKTDRKCHGSFLPESRNLWGRQYACKLAELTPRSIERVQAFPRPSMRWYPHKAILFPLISPSPLVFERRTGSGGEGGPKVAMGLTTNP
jgi:hypothetical protein